MRGAVLVMLAMAACSAPNEATSQQALVQITSPNPDVIGFGSQAVGTTSTPVPIKISPQSGAQSDRITSVELSCGSGSPFSLVGVPQLPATVSDMCQSTDGSGNCTEWTQVTQTFNVEFTPMVTGETSCTVNITLDSGTPSTICNGSDNLCVPLSGSGTVGAYQLAAPTSVDFGNVHVGTDVASVPVYIVNYGNDQTGPTATANATSNATNLAFGPGSAFASDVPGNGGDDIVTTTCQAAATAGSGSGNLAMTFSDGVNPLNVALTCTGVTSALQFSPAPVVMSDMTQVGGCLRVNSGMASPQVTLTNNSGSAIDFASGTAPIAITGSTDLTITSPQPTMPLASPGSATVNLSYVPTSATGSDNGLLTTVGQLTVAHDATVDSINLLACAITAKMAVAPADSLDFGAVCVNQTSDSQSIVVGMGDRASYFLTSVDPVSLPFLMTQSPLLKVGSGSAGSNAPISPTQTWSANLTASPTAAGRATTTFQVYSDIRTGSGSAVESRTISLSVTGLAPGVSADPVSLDLGVVSLGMNSSPVTVAIGNCDTAPATIDQVQLIGANPGDFSFSAPGGGSIAEEKVSNFTIVFSPKHGGNRTATLEVQTSNGTVSVPLTGTGTTTGAEPVGNATYYTCAIGSGAAMVPVALALLALVWRRRRRQ